MQFPLLYNFLSLLCCKYFVSAYGLGSSICPSLRGRLRVLFCHSLTNTNEKRIFLIKINKFFQKSQICRDKQIRSSIFVHSDCSCALRAVILFSKQVLNSDKDRSHSYDDPLQDSVSRPDRRYGKVGLEIYDFQRQSRIDQQIREQSECEGDAENGERFAKHRRKGEAIWNLNTYQGTTLYQNRCPIMKVEPNSDTKCTHLILFVKRCRESFKSAHIQLRARYGVAHPT